MPRQAPTPGSSRQRRRFTHSCRFKIRYQSKESAERARVEMSAKYPDTLLQVYECLCCGFLHLGNEMTKLGARRGLKKIEDQMKHPNFWTKAPKEVIDYYQKTRLKCLKRLGLPQEEMLPVLAENAVE